MFVSVLFAALVMVVANGLGKEENLEMLSLPYPTEGCTIPLPSTSNSSSEFLLSSSSVMNSSSVSSSNENGTKFMIVMQLGRVGSTWLTEMIGKNKRVKCKQEELANAGTVKEESRMPRLEAYYSGEEWKHRGAKQKSPVIFDTNKTTAKMLASLGVRFICLARSNPVEFSLAQVNGDAHQRACNDHVYRGGKRSCYTEEESRRQINKAIWDKGGFSGLVHLYARKNVKFYQDCLEMSKLTPVLWLEYGDLHCDTDETMRKIERFLDIETSTKRTYSSSQQKLTGSPRDIIDDYEKLEERLTNVSPVYGAALDLANVCEHHRDDFATNNATTPGFCPLPVPSRSSSL